MALTVSADTLTLVLSDTAWLFQPPPLDPLRGMHDARSGIERITDALAPVGWSPRREAAVKRLHVQIPAAQFNADSERMLRAALRGYCDVRIEETERALATLRQAQRGALHMGLLFLAVCLSLSTLSEQAQALPPFLRRLTTEGFQIAGWVGMWRPLELLLFDPWPQVRARKLYQGIRDMPLGVSPGTAVMGMR